MVSFVALYRGDSLSSAELIAVSNDSDLVTRVAEGLLEVDASRDPAVGDPVVGKIKQGRQAALQMVRDESDARSDSGNAT